MEQFDKKIDWNASHKLCKVYERKDKNGDTYYMGEMNKAYQMTVRKCQPNQWIKPGTWEVCLVPINYTRKESPSKEVPPPNIQYGDGVPY